MKLTAVVTGHNNLAQLKDFLYQLSLQSYPPDEVIVLASDIVSFEHNNLYICPNRDDWGHEKRAMGLFLAKGEYVGFFNSDDRYDPEYLNTLITHSDSADLIYCDFHSHLFGGIRYAAPKLQSITSGNFIIKTTLAQEVGYNHRVYEADGLFIEDVMKKGATHKRVPQVLYWHQ